MTLNRLIASTLAIHTRLDGMIATTRGLQQARARRPLPAGASLADRCQKQWARASLQVLGAAREVGCGLSVAGALRTQAGLTFERAHLGFMARGRSGRLTDLAATAAALAAKVTVLAVGLGVVAPLVGLVAGVDAWLAAGDRSAQTAVRAERSPPRAAGRRPTSSELRDIMQRHGERVSAAL